MVARVDVARDERGCLRIRARNGETIDPHNVKLEPDGDEPVDVLLDRDENFAGHVATFFGAGRLILNVDPCSAFLHEKLGKFHRGSKTAVPGVGVCDDRAEIVNCGGRGELRITQMGALLALLAVVEKLSGEEMLDLIRHSVVGVILESSGYSGSE